MSPSRSVEPVVFSLVLPGELLKIDVHLHQT